MVNYEKLALGRTLNEYDGDKYNHGDCFNYGSVGGCDEYCPALNKNECEIYKSVDDYIKTTKGE
jgi:hypothetical protein